MSSNAFPDFCQSLGMNKSLKDLDLRNNQITHTSALELCTAIEANTTLQNLGRLFVCICFAHVILFLILFIAPQRPQMEQCRSSRRKRPIG